MKSLFLKPEFCSTIGQLTEVCLIFVLTFISSIISDRKLWYFFKYSHWENVNNKTVDMSEIDWLMAFQCTLILKVVLNMYNTTLTSHKKATIHQVTTMLAASKNVLFPGHNHLLTTSTDDPSPAGTQVIIKVSGHQYRWTAGGYELEIGHGEG